jgi:uncharacterized protein involved in exopolysaccharide biosynthesis
VSRYLETFFRNRWLLTMPALIILASGVGLALLLPPQYEAKATIWTDTATYLDTPTPDNRYTPPAEIESQRFNELVQTYTFASAVLNRLPNAANATREAQAVFVKRLQDDLQIASTGDNTVQVSFKYADQQVALAVVQSTIDEYKRVMAETASLQATEAIAFYQQQVRMYEQEIMPRSTRAIQTYLEAHPEASRVGMDGVPLDPQFALLDQQARADRATYQRYQQRLNDVQTQSQAASTSQPVAFRVIDPPLVPADSGKPSKKLLILLLGVSVGLSIGYVLLFLGLATELDRTLRTAHDVRRKLNMPVLDVVPDYVVGRAARKAWRAEHAAQPPFTQSLPSKSSI